MSLSAIQDNLVKTNLVQQTQARGDEVHRSQQIAQTTAQAAEHDRQHDQVVLMTRSKEQHTINPDEQRERQEQEKKRSGTATARIPPRKSPPAKSVTTPACTASTLSCEPTFRVPFAYSIF